MIKWSKYMGGIDLCKLLGVDNPEDVYGNDYEVELVPMPNCCSVRVLVGLGPDDDEDDWSDGTIEGYKELLSKLHKRMDETRDEYCVGINEVRCGDCERHENVNSAYWDGRFNRIVAYMNWVQYAHIGHLFKEFGWTITEFDDKYGDYKIYGATFNIRG